MCIRESVPYAEAGSVVSMTTLPKKFGLPVCLGLQPELGLVIGVGGRHGGKKRENGAVGGGWQCGEYSGLKKRHFGD